MTKTERNQIAFFAAWYKMNPADVFTLPVLFERIADEAGRSIGSVVNQATEKPEAGRYIIGLAHKAAVAFRADTTKH